MVDTTLNVTYTPVKIISDMKQKQNDKLTIKCKNRKIATCHNCCRKPCGLTLLAAFAILSGLAALSVWQTGFLDTMITRTLILRNNTDMFEMWARPPVQPLVKIYLFNYTNVPEFEKGLEKLRVQELGPYVYRQTLQKVNVDFHDNETVSFQENRNYQFVPDMSVGSLDDIVVAPNLALLSAISQARDMNYFIKLSLATLIGGLQVRPFHELRVGDYIWGYDDTLFDMARPIINMQRTLPFDRIGILAGKNGTQMPHLAVYTGEKDISHLGVVAEMDGMTKLDMWSGDECNRIDGSEGTMFPPPLVSTGQTLHIYSAELCRRLSLAFQHPIKIHDLPAMRFSPPEDIFSQDNSDNSCYCPGGICPPNGVFDASPCAFGGPAMASFPHFYQGDPALQDTIDGLSPNKEDHEFFLDIHERFGVILGGKSRMQLNIMARTTSTFPCMAAFKKDLILPAAWFEVGVDDLPNSIKSDLQLATHTATHGLLYFLLVCFVVSCSFFAYQVTKRTRSSSPPPLYIKDTILVPQIAISHQC